MAMVAADDHAGRQRQSDSRATPASSANASTIGSSAVAIAVVPQRKIRSRACTMSMTTTTTTSVRCSVQPERVEHRVAEPRRRASPHQDLADEYPPPPATGTDLPGNAPIGVAPIDDAELRQE